MSKYQDMIHLERPISKRKKMSLTQRAAQFSPFAALTGHDQAIKETARLTSQRIELDEHKISKINEILIDLRNQLPCIIKVTYFIPDEFKDGGTYNTIIDRLIKIDENNCLLLFENHLKINFYDIIDINMN